jgi:hypothetical protein
LGAGNGLDGWERWLGEKEEVPKRRGELEGGVAGWEEEALEERRGKFVGGRHGLVFFAFCSFLKLFDCKR